MGWAAGGGGHLLGSLEIGGQESSLPGAAVSAHPRFSMDRNAASQPCFQNIRQELPDLASEWQPSVPAAVPSCRCWVERSKRGPV